MRVTKQQAQQNRDRIVATAAALFREHGFDGVGVAQIMDGAGFTHGGFYNHFSSKTDLVAEASAEAFRETARRYEPCNAASAIDQYLSDEHRQARTTGCPAAALGSEAGRQSEETRVVFARGIEELIRAIEHGLPPSAGANSTPRTTSIATLSQIVGAIILSRACPDEAPLANEILDASRATLRSGAPS